MSRPRTVFLTGATGFLGSHLAARFLQQGHRVLVLARSSKNASATQRVQEILHDVGVTQFENLTVLEGDIAASDLGLTDALRRKVTEGTDEVWHCAASLSFQQEDRGEIFRMNFDGTRHVLDLVKETPERRIHHISTAYIAGKRSDIVLETEIDVGQEFKNPYEESKCQAELLIADEHRTGKVVASVYRPSIVIGDSRSGRVTHFHGVYAFIRALWTALQRLRRRSQQSRATHLPLRVLGIQTQTLNFVPIDYVVEGMFEISRRPESIGGTYHLTNPVPTENRFWLPAVCRALRVEGIQLVGETSFLQTPMTKLEALFQKQMAFYYQYLQGEPRFDCRCALEALKNTGIRCPRFTAEFICKMMGWYVDFLETQAARAGLMPNSGKMSLS